MVQGSDRMVSSSESLAWVHSSLQWARERDRKKLEELLEAVATELVYEETHAELVPAQAP